MEAFSTTLQSKPGYVVVCRPHARLSNSQRQRLKKTGWTPCFSDLEQTRDWLKGFSINQTICIDPEMLTSGQLLESDVLRGSNMYKYDLTPPEYIYGGIRCQGTSSSPAQRAGHMILYGIEGRQNDVDLNVFDSPYYFENNKVAFTTDVEFNRGIDIKKIM